MKTKRLLDTSSRKQAWKLPSFDPHWFMDSGSKQISVDEGLQRAALGLFR